MFKFCARTSIIRTHGVLCLSQAILIIHAFVVKYSLDSAHASSASLPATRREQLDAAAPLAFASIRACISAPILLALYRIRGPSQTKRTSPVSSSKTNGGTWSHARSSSQFIGAALCGFFGVFLYPLLYILGMKATTPTAACVCEALTPVFSLLIEIIWPLVRQFLGENHKDILHRVPQDQSTLPRLSSKRAVAVLLAVGGSITMTLHGAWMEQGDSFDIISLAGSFSGNVLISTSALAYALFLTVQRRAIVFLGTSVMYMTAWGNVFGAFFLFLTALVCGALSPTVLSSFGAGYWASLIWAALVTSVIGYSLEGLANAWSSPTLVAAYNAVQPFGAGMLSHSSMTLQAHHPANATEMCCAAMVASGVLLLRTDGHVVLKNGKPSRAHTV